MRLGAAVCLARVPRCDRCPLAELCPSRGQRFEPARKQPRFEGSFRQRRTDTLRSVMAGPWAMEALDAEAVAALARDGLVEVENGLVRLAQ
jgi:A/G-specific adenine glycosylase